MPRWLLPLWLTVLGGVCCCEDEALKKAPPRGERAREAVRADLADLRRVGAIRLLLLQRKFSALPREGTLFSADVVRVKALADRLGLKARTVPVERPAALIGALRSGRGDLVGTLLRSDRSLEGVSFSTPVRHVKQVVVVGLDVRGAPRRPADLAKHTIVLSAGSDARATLEKIEKSLGVELKVDTAPGHLDVDDVLYRVGSGEYPLTVARSDEVDAYLTYRDDVKIAFALTKRIPLAWAVRKEASNLLDAVNGLLYEYALTTHRRQRHGGDLKEIRRRGVLRVGLLNNYVAYFIYRGQELGFQFELADLLAQRLSVRLEVVVPERPADLTRLLVENRADLVAVSPLPNDAHAGRVAYSEPFCFADHVLVQPADSQPITDLASLAGKAIHVRRSSQYFDVLKQAARSVPGLTIVEADEHLETEALIDLVGRKRIGLTVANSILLDVERTYRNDVQRSLVFTRRQPLVWAVRKNSPRLLERANRFVRQDCRGAHHRALYDKYFTQNKRMSEVRTDALALSGAISPYDHLVRKYGRVYGIDWRLILAQMYQESRFDASAKSWAGAMGLLQVMPNTAEELGVEDPWDPESNIRAGVRYLASLLSRFEPSLPMRQRVRFALAAYNAGIGHVADARRLAREQGLNPNRWFGNVERAIALLEMKEYYQRARHGYCRGKEPMWYVSRIQTKYDAYARLMPAEGRREIAR